MIKLGDVNDSLFASGLENGEIKIYNYDSFKLDLTLSNSLSANEIISLACIDNTRLASGSDYKNIIIWNYLTGERIGSVFAQHSDWVLSLASYNANFLISASRDASFILWNLNDSNEFKIFTNNNGGHEQSVNDIVVFEDRNVFATCSNDPSVKLIDIINKKVIFTFDRNNLNGPEQVLVVLTKLDNRYLASGDRNNKVLIYDLDTNTVKHSLDPKSGGIIFSLQNLSGNLIASGSSDRNVYIWNYITGESTSRLNSLTGGDSGEIKSLAYVGKNLASGGSGRSIKIWNV